MPLHKQDGVNSMPNPSPQFKQKNRDWVQDSYSNYSRARNLQGKAVLSKGYYRPFNC